jgi:hypothetical protein
MCLSLSSDSFSIIFVLGLKVRSTKIFLMFHFTFSVWVTEIPLPCACYPLSLPTVVPYFLRFASLVGMVIMYTLCWFFFSLSLWQNLSWRVYKFRFSWWPCIFSSTERALQIICAKCDFPYLPSREKGIPLSFSQIWQVFISILSRSWQSLLFFFKGYKPFLPKSSPPRGI